MDDKFVIGEAPDPVTEVKNLLKYNDFLYEEYNGSFILRFEDRGMKWKTVISCVNQRVLIYSIYPFPVSGGEKLEKFVSGVNSRAASGAMFTKEENGKLWLVFRTGSELFDAYSAYETIGRDIEYNADVITALWNEASHYRSAEIH